MSAKKNYDLDDEDYAQIDAWAEGASEKYAVDCFGRWYKTEEDEA